jgi:hypothetical protein
MSRHILVNLRKQTASSPMVLINTSSLVEINGLTLVQRSCQLQLTRPLPTSTPS